MSFQSVGNDSFSVHCSIRLAMEARQFYKGFVKFGTFWSKEGGYKETVQWNMYPEVRYSRLGCHGTCDDIISVLGATKHGCRRYWWDSIQALYGHQWFPVALYLECADRNSSVYIERRDVVEKMATCRRRKRICGCNVETIKVCVAQGHWLSKEHLSEVLCLVRGLLFFSSLRDECLDSVRRSVNAGYYVPRLVPQPMMIEETFLPRRSQGAALYYQGFDVLALSIPPSFFSHTTVPPGFFRGCRNTRGAPPSSNVEKDLTAQCVRLGQQWPTIVDLAQLWTTSRLNHRVRVTFENSQKRGTIYDGRSELVVVGEGIDRRLLTLITVVVTASMFDPSRSWCSLIKALYADFGYIGPVKYSDLFRINKARLWGF